MNGNGHLASVSAEELRATVRAVLREVLPGVLGDAAAGRPTGERSPVGAVPPAEGVVLADDQDLDRFVRRLAALCEDPAQRAALGEGRRRFRLAGRLGGSPAPGHSGTTAPSGSPVTRVEKGAVTERTVARAAADGSRLVLGARAVMTPLARDKARVLGVEIEKER